MIPFTTDPKNHGTIPKVAAQRVNNGLPYELPAIS